jgi:uncharacterized protein YwgA
MKICIERLFLSTIKNIKTIIGLGQGCEVKHMAAPNAEFEKKRDLVLFILTKVGAIEGRTRLQKMIFIGQEELGLPKLFDFRKHYYGPYSSDISDTIQTLILQGDIIEEVEDNGQYIQYSYRLSKPDKTQVQGFDEISDDQIKMLKKLSNTPLSLILAYVYQQYAEPPGSGEIQVPV